MADPSLATHLDLKGGLLTSVTVLTVNLRIHMPLLARLTRKRVKDSDIGISGMKINEIIYDHKN